MGDAKVKFAALYDAHHAQVVSYCNRRSAPDSAEDLVSEVFLTAWRRIDDAPSGERALPWLYQIAFNVAGNHWRGRDRRHRVLEKLRTVRTRTSTPLADSVEVRDEVRRVLVAAENLRDGDIEILRLFHWEQLTVAEIATVLDLSVNTAKQRLRRARKSLISEFEHLTGRTAAPDLLQLEGGGQ